MKARLVLATAAVAVVGLVGVTSASAEECADGTVVQVHLSINGEQTDICLPPSEGGAPELPALPGAPELPAPPALG